MPNWCNNWAEITGPTEKMEELFEAGKDEKFLEHMAPLGEWEYHDALSSWGTKWEIDTCDLALIKNGDTATIRGYFQSAWSPPEQAFMTYMMNNEGVSADCLYFEPAMDFVGSISEGTFSVYDNKAFFENDPVGIKFDEHFGIIDMLEEYDEELQFEAINTDPTILTNPEGNDSKTEETTE